MSILSWTEIHPSSRHSTNIGCSNLRKVKILLDALDRKCKDITYYALDLSPTELERTLAEVPQGTFQHVTCCGLLGTYDDGLAWLKQPANKIKQKTILSLGSSIGNFDRIEAAEFIAQFADILTPIDTMLLGLDACTDADKVYHAYNDREGLTHEFILNGLAHANHLLGSEAFKREDWKVIGRYNQEFDRHEAFVSPSKDVKIEGVTIRADEQVRIEESWKYNWTQSKKLWADARVSEGARWVNKKGNYGTVPIYTYTHSSSLNIALHLLNRPKVSYPTAAKEYATHPVPSLADWADLWTAWDCVTQDMIPEEELLEQPIKLRNACIFYLGHIPTFMDIHLTRATRGKATEPKYYTQIFERGVDPDVDDPDQCHAHSEIPDSWPATSEILTFQARVRDRTRDLYASGQANNDPRVSRALWLAYEHEIMHLETLLYMLVQSEKTLAPPGTIVPDFEALAMQAEQKSVANQWFKIPAQDIEIGLTDPDNNSGPAHYFGWDNEKPKRTIHVPCFSAQARPITNREYAHYLEKNAITQVPASWVPLRRDSAADDESSKNNHAEASVSQDFLRGKAVRTVYGAVPLRFALDWPVSASYDELAACAKYMGGRIPSMEEARSIYHYVETSRKDAEQKLGKSTPAVNGHLINNGVQESPPLKTLEMLDPRELHIELQDANVGFKHWHPVSVTEHGGMLAGQAGMGGVWEWTSSVLRPHEGFEPMELYPAYTCK